MPSCPKCQHVWYSSIDLDADKPSLGPKPQVTCPKCGNQFDPRAPVVDDPMATLPGSADSSAATISEATRTIDQTAGAATISEGTQTLDQTPGAATIDASTLSESAMATLEAAPQPHATHIVDDPNLATLDLDAAEYQDLIPTMDKSGPDATRQSDPLSTANFDLSISGEATLDSSAGQGTAGGALGSQGLRVSRSGVSSQPEASSLAKGGTRTPSSPTRRGTPVDDSPLTSIGTDANARSIKHVSVSNRKIAPSDQELALDADYRLLHKLGEGAMGVVYAARQCSIDRIVAIKAIKKTNEGQRDSREKFLYEAQITGDLDHPNIVPIHELGENDDGTLFYAMKMVSGTPWQKVIASRSREDNVESLMKVADAIAFAHSKRVIHRDLKPENIMLGSFGEVLVMDWGLAVPLDRNIPFGLGGTPAYMAPEMAAHQVAKIGLASDIYLLGAILFQIVTGVPPHPGNTGTECLMAAVRNHFVDISSDDALLRIARKAMESEPADRYASVQEFQEAIRQYKRHAESIAITGRSRAQVQEAMRTQNYEAFARAIFGFQDALLLWSENTEAQSESQKAKLEYARCALAKSDFDLCLSTLVGITDPCLDAAEQLRSEAQRAKQARADKERRLVVMRRMLAGVVLVAVTSLSGLSLFLYSARSTILTQNARLEQQRNNLEIANQSEQSARLAAESARATAEAAAKSENEARQLAEKSLQAEQAARAEREVALRNEQAAKAEETRQRRLAQASAEEATQARNAEVLAAQAARRSALLARLGEYQTGLNLAMTQTDRLDVPHSHQQLNFIANLEKTLDQPAPKLTNWLYRRVQALNNVDLPKLELNIVPTCASTWSGQNRLAIGDQVGNIYVLEVQGNQLTKLRQLPAAEPSRVVDLALAPNGLQLVSLHARRDDTFANLYWNLSGEQPARGVALKDLAHAALQHCMFSRDGRYVIGGNSGGLAVLSMDARGPQELKRLPMKGQLLSLSWQPGADASTALALVRQATDESFLYRIDLQSMTSQPLVLPNDLGKSATCASMTGDNRGLLGDDQGRVFLFTLPDGPAKSTSNKSNGNKEDLLSVSAVNELSAARQSSAVRRFHVDDNNRVLIQCDAPVITALARQSEQDQWQVSGSLQGLMNDVRAAGWIGGTNNLFAIDQRGTSMLWNLQQQRERVRCEPTNPITLQRLTSANIFGSAIDEETQRITTIDRVGGLQRWQVSTGRVDKFPDNTYWSYVGHTPGSQLHDWYLDRKHNQLVTCCRLSADTAKEKFTPADATDQVDSANFEICLWDVSTGNMRLRKQLSLTGGGRVALADAAKKLIITDADRTLCFELTDKGIAQPSVLAFGAALVLPNPQASHQVLLVRATGAGLIWNVKQPTARVPESSKDFNLAAANRFVPVEGGWESSGRRCYCLLENGQLARYLWDDRQLTLDRLSAPNATLACKQQVQAWQTIDMNASDANDANDANDVNDVNDVKGDQWLITLRDRNAASGSSYLVQWPLSVEQPTLTNRAFKATLLPGGALATDQCVLSSAELLVFDGAGTGFRLTTASQEVRDTVGRTQPIAVTSDASGERWIALGQQDQLWSARWERNGPIGWERMRLSLKGLRAARLSADGQYMLVQHDDTHSRGISLIDMSNFQPIEHWPGSECMTWHPRKLQLACCNLAEGSIIAYDVGRRQEERCPLPTAIKDPRRIEFFQEVWSTPGLQARQWLVVLGDSGPGSRIEFQCLPDKMQLDEWRDKPLKHTLAPLVFESKVQQVCTSPTENILAIGDNSGAVSLWFASPTIAPEARELTTLEAHRSSSVCHLQFSSAGNILVTGAQNQELYAWPALR